MFRHWDAIKGDEICGCGSNRLIDWEEGVAYASGNDYLRENKIVERKYVDVIRGDEIRLWISSGGDGIR